ncbi:MAG: phosphatidate cytidylyltransferase [Cyanobacteria bacterium P01_F01_bin.150]
MCSIFLANLIEISPDSLLTLIFLVQVNDTVGYIFGKKIGKTHVFPKISPGKTLEGYLCAGIGIIMAIILLHTYIPVLHTSLLQDSVLLLTILVAGNLGDLLFSSLKRNLEIKDFSEILPGHGGILDRFDSILFSVPFCYIIVNYGLPIYL